MGNDQLLPAYNMQAGICDKYIAVIDVKQYATDTECFVPLMDKFNELYGHYPKYPIADVGYGSFNNYLFCEEHGMEKCMKFTMFEKETKDKKYRDNPYRSINFCLDNEGNLRCPNAKNNRTIRLNRALTAIHEEVMENLCSIHGALLCMNRRIQSEGTFDVMKWDRSYKRAFRRGLENVILEFYLISCGFNLYKYHNQKTKLALCA